MSRPLDWTPLVESGQDPVPGEPDRIEQLGRHYASVADAIRRSAATLRRVADEPGEMQSEAVSAFRDQAREAAAHVSRAELRYAEAGRALLRYAPVLEDAQAQSAVALDEARGAQEQLARATTAMDDATDRLRTARPGDDLAPFQAGVARARAAGDAAHGELTVARGRLLRATQARDEAAEGAVRAMAAVRDAGNLRDNAWDQIVNVIEVAVKVLDWVALGAGLLALAVGWIPIVGQAAAAVLGTIAAAAGVLSLVGNLLLAATSNGDWSDVAWGALGTVSFGIGKLAATTFKTSAAGARGAARLKAGTEAQTSREAMRSLTPYLQQTGLRRPEARQLVQQSTDLDSWYRRIGSTTRGLPSEVGNDLATLFQRSSWEKAWQREWLPEGQGVQAGVVRSWFAEGAGADELARVNTIPDSIRADATVASHLESMQHGTRWFVGAGAYSTFDLAYVQAYEGAYRESQESTPQETLHIGAYGGSR